MPPYETPEQWLELFRAMGTPAQVRRKAEQIDEILRERRSEEYRARQAAIDEMLNEARGRRWFVQFTGKAATWAAGIATAFFGAMTVLNWLRDYIQTLK